uniref:Immunoglobulin V-set domain-containing protein n=1 Tax=Seriola lalandi dorsalis TaxID=1841481 RepID=A0A3B4XC13_SERLL
MSPRPPYCGKTRVTMQQWNAATPRVMATTRCTGTDSCYTAKTAKIKCSLAEIFVVMYTHRQLQLLGYISVTAAFPEAGVDVKIGGSANQGETSTLTIEGLSENNSTVYFCAASYHSDTHHCSSVQKPAQTVFISVLQLRVP